MIKIYGESEEVSKMGKILCFNIYCPYISADSACTKSTMMRVDEQGDCETFLKATAIKCSNQSCKHYDLERCQLKTTSISYDGKCSSYERDGDE